MSPVSEYPLYFWAYEVQGTAEPSQRRAFKIPGDRNACHSAFSDLAAAVLCIIYSEIWVEQENTGVHSGDATLIEATGNALDVARLATSGTADFLTEYNVPCKVNFFGIVPLTSFSNIGIVSIWRRSFEDSRHKNSHWLSTWLTTLSIYTSSSLGKSTPTPC